MNTSSATSPADADQTPGGVDFPAYLDELRARLAGLGTAGQGVDDPSEVLADLETAYEELRVADEEVRSQQDEITRLLVSYDDLQRQHDRTLSALPVPAVVTDADGVIRAVNAAAASLIGVGVARLLGKPVFVFFDPEQRRELRDLLDRARSEGARARALLVPRGAEPVQVAITLVERPGPSTARTWLLLPLGPGGGTELDLIPGALTELAGLPALGADFQEVLNQAAALCRRSLGGLDVSVTVGDPVAPDALASTSVLAQSVDGAQVASGEGPCATAFEDRASVVSPDVSTDPRWPRLAKMLPVVPLSALAVPIEVGQRLVGALNVYSAHAGLSSWVEDAAELLAATLGAVFYELELNSELAELG